WLCFRRAGRHPPGTRQLSVRYSPPRRPVAGRWLSVLHHGAVAFETGFARPLHRPRLRWLGVLLRWLRTQISQQWLPSGGSGRRSGIAILKRIRPEQDVVPEA